MKKNKYSYVLRNGFRYIGVVNGVDRRIMLRASTANGLLINGFSYVTYDGHVWGDPYNG